MSKQGVQATKVGCGVSVPLVRNTVAPFGHKGGIVVEELQLPPPPPGYVPKRTDASVSPPKPRPSSASDRERSQPVRVRARPTEAELEEARTAKRWPGLFQNLVGPKTALYVKSADELSSPAHAVGTRLGTSASTGALAVLSMPSPFLQKPRAVLYNGALAAPLPERADEQHAHAAPSPKVKRAPHAPPTPTPAPAPLLASSSASSKSLDAHVFGSSLKRPYNGPSLYTQSALKQGALVDYTVSTRPPCELSPAELHQKRQHAHGLARPASAAASTAPRSAPAAVSTHATFTPHSTSVSPHASSTSVSPPPHARAPLSASASSPALLHQRNDNTRVPSSLQVPVVAASRRPVPAPSSSSSSSSSALAASSVAATLADSPLRRRDVLPALNPMTQPPLDPGGPLERAPVMTLQREATLRRLQKHEQIAASRSPRPLVPNTMRRPTSPFSAPIVSPFTASAAASAATMEALLSNLDFSVEHHKERLRLAAAHAADEERARADALTAKLEQQKRARAAAPPDALASLTSPPPRTRRHEAASPVERAKSPVERAKSPVERAKSPGGARLKKLPRLTLIQQKAVVAHTSTKLIAETIEELVRAEWDAARLAFSKDADERARAARTQSKQPEECVIL